MNAFVDYLNSMNNASGDTAAALAESQVLSEFYEKIQIKRKLDACDILATKGHALPVRLDGHRILVKLQKHAAEHL